MRRITALVLAVIAAVLMLAPSAAGSIDGKDWERTHVVPIVLHT